MSKVDCALLIDDDSIDNVINTRLLKKLKFSKEVKIANNGLEAMDYLNSNCLTSRRNCPEVIFLDLDMPVMRGTDFLQEYNRLSYRSKNCAKVIVLTSLTSDEELEKVRGYDILDIVLKPLTEEKLNNVFEKLFE